MSWMEVALLVLGIGVFGVSFMLPGSKEKESDEQNIDNELIKSLIEKEIGNVKQRVNEVVDETIEYAVEKTERASERISNEKIMAINDYSETVLADINKSHQEVMFLYDMLNDKHKNIKETVKHVDKTAKEAEEAANAAALALAAKAMEVKESKKEEEINSENRKSNELNPVKEKNNTNNMENSTQISEESEAQEKEYARRQMARLILPMNQDTANIRISSIPKNEKPEWAKTVELPVKNNADTSQSQENELKPLVVREVEIISDAALKQQHKNVEVYSFAQQAPRVERATKNTAPSQAGILEDTVNMMKMKEAVAEETKADAVDLFQENNNDRILRMHKEGISNVDIAKELGLGVGEVKLVINLFKGAV